MSEWVNEFSVAHYTISWILLQPPAQLFISPNLFTLTTVSKWFILYMKQQLVLKPGGSHHPSVRANSVLGGQGVGSCLGFYLAPLPLCALVSLFYSSSTRTHRALASRYTTSSIIQLLFWLWVLTSPGGKRQQAADSLFTVSHWRSLRRGLHSCPNSPSGPGCSHLLSQASVGSICSYPQRLPLRGCGRPRQQLCLGN